LRQEGRAGQDGVVARRVVIAACPGFQPLDVVGPFDVFAGAARAAGGYTVEIAAPEAGAIEGEGGLRLLPHLRFAAVPRDLDTLIVAGGPGARRLSESRPVVDAIARLARRARRVASVCTGAFLLGAAGLLDGRRATTHWAHCAALAARFPRARVEPEPIFVRDGRVWTSAGVTAGIDLALALVEADLGRAAALALARRLVMFVRRSGGQSQFSALLESQAAEREPIREVAGWIAEHLGEASSVPELARRAGMSVRNFTRRFRDELRVSPAAYVTRLRLETARRLLESTALPVEQVAEAAGFGGPEVLRRAFARTVRLSPREYRARFGEAREAHP
jgi:transcriptional regulator GlxA family with amidase domain